jgi:alpha 1,2-mannosyltransferase
VRLIFSDTERADDHERRIAVLTPSQVEFGLIPREHWFQPDWIDEERPRKEGTPWKKKGIIYGGSVPYRNMCRFNSGVKLLPLRFKLYISLFLQKFFFRHPLMEKYRWYWRIEWVALVIVLR